MYLIPQNSKDLFENFQDEQHYVSSSIFCSMARESDREKQVLEQGLYKMHFEFAKSRKRRALGRCIEKQTNNKIKIRIFFG